MTRFLFLSNHCLNKCIEFRFKKTEETKSRGGKTFTNKQRLQQPHQLQQQQHKQQQQQHQHQQQQHQQQTITTFSCSVCEASFNQKIHLKKHSAKHTGIKPFKCNECSYSTVEKSHLKVHSRVHTGEKPFKCTICTYATAQSSTLKVLTNLRLFSCVWTKNIKLKSLSSLLQRYTRSVTTMAQRQRR